MFSLTIRLSVFIGLLKVSLILLAGGFLGFELGVWTAQHLMNTPIIIINAKPIKTTKYQYSVTHWAKVSKTCLLNSIFFNLTNGPSASTARHFKNTSQ